MKIRGVIFDLFHTLTGLESDWSDLPWTSDVLDIECLYVGDGGSDELTRAKSVGLTTVFISGIVIELWPERVPERIALSDHHIERIPQILEILGLT